MREFLLNWVGTASAHTAAVLLLRGLFGGRISARLRYALWTVALARLLVPGQFYTAPVEPPRVLPEIRTIQTLPVGRTFQAEAPETTPSDEANSPTVQAIPTPAGEEGSSPAPAVRMPVNPLALLGGVWLAGTITVAAAFLVSNWSFSRKLRRVRTPLETEDSPLPVYAAPGLPSPCLFSVLRPAVYITPEAAADPLALRHVLAHETTHYHQGDHIWSLLRCAALAVHWWNPLVWLAAALSRRDAELACDEGTLKVLGDGERRAYGNTLLSLVTAKAQPGDLLRCATTMTGDKRSLRERVRRIAKAPKRWLWAAVVSVALAALVCACSFAKTEQTPEVHADGSLTTEELQIFNNMVFNGDGFNMMNQLLFQVVETPEDYKHIDLFQLFYNGTGQPMEITEEERRAVVEEAGYSGGVLELDLIKCPAGEMDEILREYLGLSLDETDKQGLDLFTYLPEYDAYYDFHSDTNYPGEVTFTSGEWKDGKVLLYYEGYNFPVLVRDGISSLSSGPACVTLEPQEDGGYHFLSNWHQGRDNSPSAEPTAYPVWDPELVIPLKDLTPYQAPKIRVVPMDSDNVSVTRYFQFHPDESAERDFRVMIRHEADGGLSAGVRIPDGTELRFLTVSAGDAQGWLEEDGRAHIFTDLFGHYGVEISYNGWMDRTGWIDPQEYQYYGTFYDYYTFAEDGAPSLLLRAEGRAEGEPADMDLDGDGVNELTVSDPASPQLFFQRDGQIYKADIDTLIREAWPQAKYIEYGSWDAEGRFLPLSAQVPLPDSLSSGTVTAYRTLFFDGENLRIYKNNDPYTNHLAQGLDALPADVVAAARDFVQGQFDALAAEGYGTDGSGRYDEGNFGPGNVVWDDWRITGLSGPWYEAAGDIRVEIWNVSYETHTATPDRLMLAGGSYVGEDGWCMIGYPGCDYLYFRLGEHDERTYLFSKMENDCFPGTETFLADMVRALMDQGLLKLSDLDGETLAKVMWPQSAQFLNDLAEQGEAERSEILLFLAGYLAGGSEEGETYYARFCRELDRAGYRAEGLTEGGRDAWETLKDFVTELNSGKAIVFSFQGSSQ